MIRLPLERPLQLSGKLQLSRSYAAKTAVAADAKGTSFQVELDKSAAVESARLLIGVHRRGGLTEPLTVEVNGAAIQVDIGDADEFSEFFAPLGVRPCPLRS